jgi:hypothetical protein
MGDDLDEFIEAWLTPERRRHMNIKTEDKLKCIKRELGLRRNNYPKWVASGRMKQTIAEHELRVMEAIEADYEREAKQVEITFGEE